MQLEQQKRFNKISTEEFYLIGNEQSENDITLLMTGSTKNVYKISLKNDGFVTCNCPDSETHAKKHKVLCKHLCFLHFKICKSTDVTFYMTKKLSQNDREKLIDKLNSLKNTEISKKYYENYIKKINKDKCCDDDFNKAKRDIDIVDMDCPICFDELKDNIKFCPECSNPVHQKCIDKWMESHDECIYCRSDVWKKYKNNNQEIATKYVSVK
jgi:hypothetical protein